MIKEIEFRRKGINIRITSYYVMYIVVYCNVIST